MHRIAPAVFLLLMGAEALAAAANELQACATIANETERLACYDRAAGRVPADVTATTALGERWEVDPGTDRGTFAFRPYRQNYIVYRVTNHENDRPFRPLLDPAPSPDQGLEPNELKFQLSFKTKVWGNMLGTRGNLWFAYTQQSHWQLLNQTISRPFRETDYEPELMWVTPIDFSAGEVRMRYATLGFSHQSNGRTDPLSRSWNRLFAEVGGGYGKLAFWVRPWWRVPESAVHDDSPDIEKFVGRGEIVGVYKPGRQVFTATVRNNLSFGDNRGSVLADWSFPIAGALRGYVQVFSGYGESLIDYNWRQTTIGAGILLTDRL